MHTGDEGRDGEAETKRKTARQREKRGQVEMP